MKLTIERLEALERVVSTQLASIRADLAKARRPKRPPVPRRKGRPLGGCELWCNRPRHHGGECSERAQ